MSDLHLEFEARSAPAFPQAAQSNDIGTLLASKDALAIQADFVLLLGDIHTRGRGPQWAAQIFAGVQTVMLGGNHEAYGDSLYANIARNRKAAAACGAFSDGTPRVSYLERETWTRLSPRCERIRVVGATLWTDFNLFGEARRLRAQATARAGMNDFYRIEIQDDTSGYREQRRFDPEDAARIHRMSVTFTRCLSGMDWSRFGMEMRPRARLSFRPIKPEGFRLTSLGGMP